MARLDALSDEAAPLVSDAALVLRCVAPASRQTLAVWEAFLRESLHLLRRGDTAWPASRILLQLAVEHADDSPVTQAAEAWLARGHCDWLWWRAPWRPGQFARSPCLRVLAVCANAVDGVLELADQRLLCWSDWDAWIWDHDGLTTPQRYRHDLYPPERPLLTAEGAVVWWSKVETRICVWEPLTNVERAVLDTDGQPVDAIVELPNERIVGLLRDGRVAAWSARTGARLATMFGDAGPLNGIARVGHDRYACWSRDGVVQLWTSEPEACVARAECAGESIRGIVALTDGRLVSWGRDLWVWEQVAMRPKRLAVGGGGVQRVVALRDGRALAYLDCGAFQVLGRDGRLGRTLSGFAGTGDAVELDNGHILCWADGGTRPLYLWDGMGRRATRLGEYVNGASGLPDGKVLAWDVLDALRVWSPEGAVVGELRGHQGRVLGAGVFSDQCLTTWSADGTVRKWAHEQARPPTEHRDQWPKAVRALEDGSVLSSHPGGAVRLWDPRGMEVQEFDGHDAVVDLVNLLDDKFVSRSADGVLVVWNRSGEPLAVLAGPPVDCLSIVLEPPGRLLATYEDGAMLAWDFQAPGARPPAVWSRWRHRLQLACMSWIRRNATDADPAALERVDALIRRARFQCAPRVTSVRVSAPADTPYTKARRLSDGRIAFFSEDGWVSVGMPAGAASVRRQCHTSRARARSVEGGRIVTWSDDDAVRVWSSDLGAELAWFDGHVGRLRDVQYADGRALAYADDDVIYWWSAIGTSPQTLSARHQMATLWGLPEGHFLIHYLVGIVEIFDTHGGRVLALAGELPHTHPNVFHAWRVQHSPDTVCGSWVGIGGDRVTGWRHGRGTPWHAEGTWEVRALLANGTLVATSDKRMATLHLYRGNRRVSLEEAATDA